MSEPTELRESAVDVISDLSEEFAALLAASARRMSLTSVRAELVFALHTHGPQRQRALAERLGISPQQTAALVDALTEKGLVARDPDPTDRRAVLVDLTDAGQDVAAEIARLRTRTADRLLGGLSDDQVATLTELAGHVLERVRASGR